ncbi:lytic transglycosylase domain-containing protein [Pseudomonas sp. 6D_7.1_Bac1]|jgi:soluble lytic murein transglycosylase-like protein|uniref:lytic transglycosylase domain-containing protein n=1 Tax=Pseudomonas sp. 6D_7.1_Bac1 TaxID=2971615 RepID=UPI0021C668AF|nr:lytic transglycosylase domain-containing protein [Pseudomonas sp. 6D_7.1_Bac1]MCU1748792.1 lytic transglycosylase domain-containing protein [Pseudomonas sp. 6D_7.1_Bac1]
MKSNDRVAGLALKMLQRSSIITGLCVLFASALFKSAFAQDPLLNAPLVWTRGDPGIDMPSAPVQASQATPAAVPIPPQSIGVSPKQFTDTRYDRIIDTVANELQLDARLLHAMVHVESHYNSNAVSPKGALGLMQVMPATGKRFGCSDLQNSHSNVRAGATYLKWLLDHFDHNLELAVAAYNAGEGAVEKYGRQIPPYPETRNYVKKVLARYRYDPAALSVNRPVILQPPAPTSAPRTFALLAKLTGLLLSAPNSSPLR